MIEIVFIFHFASTEQLYWGNSYFLCTTHTIPWKVTEFHLNLQQVKIDTIWKNEITNAQLSSPQKSFIAAVSLVLCIVVVSS